MDHLKIYVTVFALCALLTIVNGQSPQINAHGSHINQGRVRRQVAQGGPHVDQGGPDGNSGSQGGPHENQGRVRRQVPQDESHIDQTNGNQGGQTDSRRGQTKPQGGPHENQGRTRREISHGISLNAIQGNEERGSQNQSGQDQSQVQEKGQEKQGSQNQGSQQRQGNQNEVNPGAQQSENQTQENQNIQQGQGNQTHENPDNQEQESSTQGSNNDDDDEETVDEDIPAWACAEPLISCIDCNTRLVCKPDVVLIRRCKNPNRPYCNNSTCSITPTPECVLETTEAPATAIQV